VNSFDGDNRFSVEQQFPKSYQFSVLSILSELTLLPCQIIGMLYVQGQQWLTWVQNSRGGRSMTRVGLAPARPNYIHSWALIFQLMCCPVICTVVQWVGGYDMSNESDCHPCAAAF